MRRTLTSSNPYEGGGDLLPESILTDQYPKCHNYLKNHQNTLADRGSENQIFESWYSHWCPRNPTKFKREKILIPEIVKGGAASFDISGEVFHSTTVYSPILTKEYVEDSKKILGILNSNLIWFYITLTGTILRGGFYRYKTDYLEPISLPLKVDDAEQIADSVDRILEAQAKRDALNLSLSDYLGNYTDGLTLSRLYQPPAELANSILTDTTTERANLRVGTVTAVEAGSKLVVRATARYKPDNPDEFETDRWGYTETEAEPAMEFVGLSDAERALIQAFVPHAVEEGNDFREQATKTLSPLDRLEALTLPELTDVEDGIERYWRARERAEELDEKIEKIDELIDRAVYQLYGLADEEIEIVEEAVGDD